LFAAAKRNNISLFNEYVEERGNKFDPNVLDALGNTPLHYSAGANHEEITALLLGKNADPNIKNNTSGETPLHRAIWGGHFNIVKLLVEHGADVNIANNNKQKAINLAKSSELKSYIEAAALAREVDDTDVAEDDDEDEGASPAPTRPPRSTTKPGFDADMIADDDDE